MALRVFRDSFENLVKLYCHTSSSFLPNQANHFGTIRSWEYFQGSLSFADWKFPSMFFISDPLHSSFIRVSVSELLDTVSISIAQRPVSFLKDRDNFGVLKLVGERLIFPSFEARGVYVASATPFDVKGSKGCCLAHWHSPMCSH